MITPTKLNNCLKKVYQNIKYVYKKILKFKLLNKLSLFACNMRYTDGQTSLIPITVSVVLTLIASAREAAPGSPILLLLRFSSVSVVLTIIASARDSITNQTQQCECCVYFHCLSKGSSASITNVIT